MTAAWLKRRVIEAFLEVLYSTKKEPAMNHQEVCPVLDHVMSLLIEHGPSAIANAFTIIMNLAMQIERDQTLKAESHHRTADRRLKDTVTRYQKSAPGLAGWLEANVPEAITVFGFPPGHRRRLRTN